MFFFSFLQGFHMLFCQTFCCTSIVFLFLKILHLVLYLANFIMIGLLLPLFFNPFILFCLFSIFLITSSTSSSVLLFLHSRRSWMSKQLLLEYCSCLSKLSFKNSIVTDIPLTFFCSSLIILFLCPVMFKLIKFFINKVDSFI